MKGRTLIYLIVGLWVAVFAGSVLMTLNIDGPRNIDTGFKRLDVLVRGQFLALLLAVAAGIAGFTVRDSGRRERLVGLIPLAATFTLVAAGLLLLVFMPDGPTAPTTPPAITKPIPAQPAEPVPPAD